MIRNFKQTKVIVIGDNANQGSVSNAIKQVIDNELERGITIMEMREKDKYFEITEQWLEKIGFIRDDDTSYRWFILDRSVAYDLDDNCIRISDSWEFGKRKYVHELQNLIFFLSGIELAVA
jgi:hypothetical protein